MCILTVALLALSLLLNLLIPSMKVTDFPEAIAAVVYLALILSLRSSLGFGVLVSVANCDPRPTAGGRQQDVVGLNKYAQQADARMKHSPSSPLKTSRLRWWC